MDVYKNRHIDEQMIMRVEDKEVRDELQKVRVELEEWRREL